MRDSLGVFETEVLFYFSFSTLDLFWGQNFLLLLRHVWLVSLLGELSLLFFIWSFFLHLTDLVSVLDINLNGMRLLELHFVKKGKNYLGVSEVKRLFGVL